MSDLLDEMRRQTAKRISDGDLLKFSVEADQQIRRLRRKLYRKIFDVCLLIGLITFAGVVYGWQMAVIVLGLGLLAIESEPITE